MEHNSDSSIIGAIAWVSALSYLTWNCSHFSAGSYYGWSNIASWYHTKCLDNMRPSTTCSYPVLTAETTCWTLCHPLLGQTNYIISFSSLPTILWHTRLLLCCSYHVEFMVCEWLHWARINICCLPSGSRFTVDKETSIHKKYEQFLLPTFPFIWKLKSSSHGIIRPLSFWCCWL